MPEHISGVFPGGPARDPRKWVSLAGLRSVEDMSRAGASAGRRRSMRRRRWRQALAVAAVVIAAGGVGLLMGRRAHERSLEAMREAVARSSRVDRQISAEVNRVLLELWKMEDGERMPTMRRAR